jgi:hypothetical protein
VTTGNIRRRMPTQVRILDLFEVRVRWRSSHG